MTLARLAELAGCAKSYLSAIETGRKEGTPGESLLARIEEALMLPRGRLARAARWEATPPSVRREIAELHGRLSAREGAAARLKEILGGGAGGRPLDEAFRSGELRRLIDVVAPDQESGPERRGRLQTGPTGRAPVPVMLPREIPLINRAPAGIAREFTDLGYPARVADAYVRAPDIDDPDAFALRLEGDSMEPQYREGDIVVLSPARPVKSGMDCFARFEPRAEVTFKRVYFESGPAGEELIRLQPLNPAYAPMVVPRESVAGLYAAVTVIRKL